MSSKKSGGMLLKRLKNTRKKAEPVDANGNLIGSETSLAARKRRRAGMSMVECGYDDPEGNVEDFDYTPRFEKGSIVHYSWGKTESRPITAARKKRRTGSLQMLPGKGLGRGHSFSVNGRLVKTEEPVIPNSPDRSHLLRVPLETREHIYGYLLIHKQPILLDPDWRRVERISVQDHSIIKTCKQISKEASAFLYRNNCWISLIRNGPPRKFFDSCINPAYLPLIKNAVVECDRGNWKNEYFVKTCNSVQRLVQARVRLQCLTLVVEPQRTLMTTTATGELEKRPVTFADFLSTRAKLMRIIRQVDCQVFNVILKKPGKQQFLISIDMRALALLDQDKGGGEREENEKRARRRIDVVRQELIGLKERFEEIFEDGEEAVRLGKCRLLKDGESVMDGLALTKDILRK